MKYERLAALFLLTGGLLILNGCLGTSTDATPNSPKAQLLGLLKQERTSAWTVNWTVVYDTQFTSNKIVLHSEIVYFKDARNFRFGDNYLLDGTPYSCTDGGNGPGYMVCTAPPAQILVEGNWGYPQEFIDREIFVLGESEIESMPEAEIQTLPTRQIAGTQASCFGLQKKFERNESEMGNEYTRMIDFRAEYCFSDSGIPLKAYEEENNHTTFNKTAQAFGVGVNPDNLKLPS